MNAINGVVTAALNGAGAFRGALLAQAHVDELRKRLRRCREKKDKELADFEVQLATAEQQLVRSQFHFPLNSTC